MTRIDKAYDNAHTGAWAEMLNLLFEKLLKKFSGLDLKKNRLPNVKCENYESGDPNKSEGIFRSE